jgi:hypothetical protein
LEMKRRRRRRRRTRRGFIRKKKKEMKRKKRKEKKLEMKRKKKETKLEMKRKKREEEWTRHADRYASRGPPRGASPCVDHALEGVARRLSVGRNTFVDKQNSLRFLVPDATRDERRWLNLQAFFWYSGLLQHVFILKRSKSLFVEEIGQISIARLSNICRANKDCVYSISSFLDKSEHRVEELYLRLETRYGKSLDLHPIDSIPLLRRPGALGGEVQRHGAY